MCLAFSMDASQTYLADAERKWYWYYCWLQNNFLKWLGLAKRFPTDFCTSLLPENRWKPLRKSKLFCNRQYLYLVTILDQSIHPIHPSSLSAFPHTHKKKKIEFPYFHAHTAYEKVLWIFLQHAHAPALAACTRSCKRFASRREACACCTCCMYTIMYRLASRILMRALVTCTCAHILYGEPYSRIHVPCRFSFREQRCFPVFLPQHRFPEIVIPESLFPYNLTGAVIFFLEGTHCITCTVSMYIRTYIHTLLYKYTYIKTRMFIYTYIDNI